MRISDWSSDVCSSDLAIGVPSEASSVICGGAIGSSDFDSGAVTASHATERMNSASSAAMLRTSHHSLRRPRQWSACNPRVCASNPGQPLEIGRAYSRASLFQYLSLSVVAVTFKKKKYI